MEVLKEAEAISEYRNIQYDCYDQGTPDNRDHDILLPPATWYQAPSLIASIKIPLREYLLSKIGGNSMTVWAAKRRFNRTS